jgi:hypothetical protein
MAAETFTPILLPETSVRQPDELLALYSRMLADDIPGFVIRQSSLHEVAGFLVPTGLVVPSNANGTPGNTGEHESRSLITEDSYDLGYHTHGLPQFEAPTTIIHHETTVGTHEHTLATFAPDFAASLQVPMDADERYDTNLRVSELAEIFMRRGQVDPTIMRPAVYRARVETGDIVVNRLTGASPDIHDFHTIEGPDEGSDLRTATIRGYTAAGVYKP